MNREQQAFDRWLTTEPEPVPEPDEAAPDNFDGWVMFSQFAPGVLLQTDIEAIDTDHQDAPLCDSEHDVARAATYSLTSPEEALTLCTPCVRVLVVNAGEDGYVIGALPAN